LAYLRNKIGVRGKIGVYGRSLGGIATCHLAKYVDMIIVDRSFANLHDVVEQKFFGKIAVSLVKFATGGWRATNDLDFIKIERDSKYGCNTSKNCYKLLTCDKNDEIIELQSSLMIGVAKQYCFKHNDVRLLTNSEI